MNDHKRTEQKQQDDRQHDTQNHALDTFPLDTQDDNLDGNLGPSQNGRQDDNQNCTLDNTQSAPQLTDQLIGEDVVQAAPHVPDLGTRARVALAIFLVALAVFGVFAHVHGYSDAVVICFALMAYTTYTWFVDTFDA